jgi:hypothetical protein
LPPPPSAWGRATGGRRWTVVCILGMGSPRPTRHAPPTLRASRPSRKSRHERNACHRRRARSANARRARLRRRTAAEIRHVCEWQSRQRQVAAQATRKRDTRQRVSHSPVVMTTSPVHSSTRELRRVRRFQTAGEQSFAVLSERLAGAPRKHTARRARCLAVGDVLVNGRGVRDRAYDNSLCGERRARRAGSTR